MDLKKELAGLLKGEISDDNSTLDAYSRDASIFELQPKLIVYPKDVEDMSNLVKFANKHAGVHLTVRSGGTDMTGGPLTTSIVVDMTRHFNNIKIVTPLRAITQPGVYYRDFEKQTISHGALLPSYPASRSICTVGGMVANNSGGEKNLRYGKTERYVQQLKVICADGNEYVIRPLDKKELNNKLAQTDFEGQLYRKMYQLIEKNYDAIQAARPDVSKNSAGYALWNIWDRKTFDMTQLFTGSQGTLGIITEISFKLIKPKKHSRLLILFLKNSDITNLAKITNLLLKHRPESLEAFDDHTVKLAVRYMSSFSTILNNPNLFSLALQFLPEAWMVVTGGIPKLIVLAEFSGGSEHETLLGCQQAQKDLAQFKIKSRITETKQDAAKYWAMRHESFNLIRRQSGANQSAPFIDDLIVKPELLPKFLPRLDTILKKYDLVHTFAGHIGDGNVHIITLMDLRDPRSKGIIESLSKQVYDLVLEFGGSVTAEHNDGLLHSAFLKQMYGSKIYTLFKQTKTIFDPHNIFNPGKKIGVTLKKSLGYLHK